MIERTLVLMKPDAVQRGVMGEILQRFERTGLKVVGMKMVWVDEKFALKHYTEDLAKRRGEQVRKSMVAFLQEGPVVAIVFEGIDAVEVVRKMVGSTEPKAAAPGTIRGDYAHMSFAHGDECKKVVRNLIHASGNREDAQYEVPLWFEPKELHTYKTVHDIHIL